MLSRGRGLAELRFAPPGLNPDTFTVELGFLLFYLLPLLSVFDKVPQAALARLDLTHCELLILLPPPCPQYRLPAGLCHHAIPSSRVGVELFQSIQAYAVF